MVRGVTNREAPVPMQFSVGFRYELVHVNGVALVRRIQSAIGGWVDVESVDAEVAGEDQEVLERD